MFLIGYNTNNEHVSQVCLQYFDFTNLASGFLLDQGPGLFEPIHGSAPDIAGQVGSSTFALYFPPGNMLTMAYLLSIYRTRQTHLLLFLVLLCF